MRTGWALLDIHLQMDFSQRSRNIPISLALHSPSKRFVETSAENNIFTFIGSYGVFSLIGWSREWTEVWHLGKLVLLMITAPDQNLWWVCFGITITAALLSEAALRTDTGGWLTLALQLRGRHAATCPKARRSPKARSTLHHHQPAAETVSLVRDSLHSNRSCRHPQEAALRWVLSLGAPWKIFFFHVWNSERAGTTLCSLTGGRFTRLNGFLVWHIVLIIFQPNEVTNPKNDSYYCI